MAFKQIRSSISKAKLRVDQLVFTDDYKFELVEPKWAAKITSVDPKLTNGAIVLSSLIAGVLAGHSLWLWFLLFTLIIGLSIILDFLHGVREQDIARERQAIEHQAVRDLVHTLVDTTQGTIDALTLEESHDRIQNLAAARRAILSTVRRSIGPATGVRVNFFEVTSDSPPTLQASTYGHEGRQNHRSNRKFTLADESFQLALRKNQGRFVEDAHTDGLTTNEEYQTFATMPVSSDNVFYGLLTVDSPLKGDINEFEARELLNLFASQLALTFTGQQDEDLSFKTLKIGDTYHHTPPPSKESPKMEVTPTLGKDHQDEP